MVPHVISKKNNVSEINVRKWLEQEEKSWIEKNKIDPNKFKDRRKLYKQRQKIALNVYMVEIPHFPFGMDQYFE